MSTQRPATHKFSSETPIGDSLQFQINQSLAGIDQQYREAAERDFQHARTIANEFEAAKADAAKDRRLTPAGVRDATQQAGHAALAKVAIWNNNSVLQQRIRHVEDQAFKGAAIDIPTDPVERHKFYEDARELRRAILTRAERLMWPALYLASDDAVVRYAFEGAPPMLAGEGARVRLEPMLSPETIREARTRRASVSNPDKARELKALEDVLRAYISIANALTHDVTAAMPLGMTGTSDDPIAKLARGQAPNHQ